MRILYDAAQGGDQGSAGGAGGSGGTGQASSGAGSGTGGAGNGNGSGSLLGGGTGSAGAGTGQGTGKEGTGTGTQAGGTAPFFVGLYDGTGKIDKTKLEHLPAHLKPYKDTFARYDTAEALFSGMGNLIQLAGKKGLEPLPPDAPAEVKAERAALMRKLNNAPEKVEGYGIKKPEGTPDELWSPEYVNGALSILHKHGASPEMVKDLIKMDSDYMVGLTTEGKAKEAENIVKEGEALKKAFGSDYEQKIELAKRGAATLGLDVNDPLFRSAKYAVAMAKVAELVSEDRLVSGNGSNGSGQSDRAKALDIVQNAGNALHKAYHDSGHPQHQSAVQQVSAFNTAWAKTQRK